MGTYTGRVLAINKKYREQRPEGYLTENDYLDAERQRKRAGQAFGAFSSAGRAGAINRSRARGVASSPALERTLGRFSQDEGRYLEGINSGVEEKLYNTRMGREGFDRERLMYGWGSELGAGLQDWQAEQAKSAQFWNSLIPLGTEALGAIFGAPGVGGSGSLPKMGQPGFTYPVG